MQPRYRRSCSPAAQHQGHTTANPAQKTMQPPPLEQARSRTDPASAQDTASAGLIAAARAAEIATAGATAAEAKNESATAVAGTSASAATATGAKPKRATQTGATVACSGVTAAAPVQRKPLRPIRPKNVEINTNDPWWGHQLLIDQARMTHENDPSRYGLSKAGKTDETFNEDRLRSKNALMLNHTEFLERMKGSNFKHDQERELRPYGSGNPAFKSSYVNYHHSYGQKPTYICKACEHETHILSNFKVHHRTQKHMYYLNAWNYEENKKLMDLQEQPLSKKSKNYGFG